MRGPVYFFTGKAFFQLCYIDLVFGAVNCFFIGDELTEVLMSRYEKSATIITSNRTIDDWGKLLGDVVIATPLLDRIMHHGHLLNFEGKSWRLREAASRLAKRGQDA